MPSFGRSLGRSGLSDPCGGGTGWTVVTPPMSASPRTAGDDDYDSQQPLHPARQFQGREQVRKNWSAMFREIPDFRADVLAVAVAGDVI